MTTEVKGDRGLKTKPQQGQEHLTSAVKTTKGQDSDAEFRLEDYCTCQRRHYKITASWGAVREGAVVRTQAASRAFSPPVVSTTKPMLTDAKIWGTHGYNKVTKILFLIAWSSVSSKDKF